MSFLDAPRFRAAFIALVFFTLFAGDAWRYAISWVGFGVVVVAILAVSVVLLVRAYRSGAWTWPELPIPLVVFLGLATVSVAWSFYPGATALGLIATWLAVIIGASIAVNYDWARILRGLSTALRVILGLSLLFELVVSLFVRRPLLPFFTLADIDSYETIPKLLYWSRDLLFEGGKIQGIVGNSSLLAMVSLVALIVFGIQLAGRHVSRVAGIVWIAGAIGGILLTRSATITVALVVLAIVTIAILAIRRLGRGGRAGVYAALLGLVVAGIIAVVAAREPLLAVLGKSSDLTGRLDIWSAVIHLAEQRPAVGWGWVSWWIPWIPPFDTLAFESGVRQLHAHNAWLDIWFQLGVVGVVVFGAVMLTTALRSWQLAVDRPQVAPGVSERYTALSLLPILLVVALLVQSVAESRLLVEYGLALVVILAMRTKLGTRATG